MKRTASSPAYETEVDFAVRIPTSSGIELGATVTRPRTEERCPALVWYDPYRGAWEGNVGAQARYFAARGYVFVNLHVRGTGNSEGVSRDEYMAEETQDGCDAVEWLAAQPWCSGSVGMLGASYSGFTALQVAALAPPALKAIAPAYFTDRRYTDDCHYKGGCLRGYYDVLTYGLSMVARNALPPHPRAVGERWAEMWRQRLEESEPYLLKWLAHPVEDAYWAQGSVIGRCDRIRAACFLIGGWHDGYVNPPLRTFRALTAPRRLLMGPWSHTYPDRSHCGPRIDIHFELLRWWDRWLKGSDNGVEREPRVMVYVQEFEEPIQDRTHIAGGWFGAEDLPGEDDFRFWISDSGLARIRIHPPKPQIQNFPYLPGASRCGGVWDAGIPFCLPGDQRPDEALALNYTSEPLTEDLVLFGQPSVSLTVSADVPVLPFAFRLCDVSEEGTSVLVTKGLLNATRRGGMDAPEPLTPDVPTPIRFDLEATAWRFRAGHRIRLSLNGSDFPNVWPTPYRGRGAVHQGPDIEAVLSLPTWKNPAPSPVALLPSEHGPASTGSGGDPPPWRVVHDVLEDRLHFVLASGSEFCISNRMPAEAYARAKSVGTAGWPGFAVRSEASAALVSDERAFHITLSLNVSVNEELHFQRQWRQSTERRLL
jgi:putative CocE/NonD family hydrolase